MATSCRSSQRAPILLRHLRGLGHARPQLPGIVGQPRRGAQRLHVHLPLEIARPVVAVDDTGDPLVEAKAEQQVVPGDRVGSGDQRLAAHRRHPGAVAHAPMPPVSPTKGIPSSAALRLMRSAAVFCSATSRT